MKMKLNRIITLGLAILLIACDTVDFGHTNDNPNGPSKPYPAGMLAASIMTYATQTGRAGLMQPTLYVQYQAQVTYTDEMLYNEVPTDWIAYYRDILNNLKVVIEYNSDPNNVDAILAAQGPENQIAVAKIFRAIVMKRVTDTWGDAPFSEAFLGGEEITPVYDAQDNLYKTLIQDLKDGRDALDAGKLPPAGDIIYGGDVTLWQKLANSVIMQMAITLSKAYPTVGGYADTEFSNALAHSAGVIEDVSEEAWFQYKDLAGFRNPWNQNRVPDYYLSREFTDAFKGHVFGVKYDLDNDGDLTDEIASLNPTSNHTYDARLEVYADDYTKNGTPYGFKLGTGAGAPHVSGVNYWNNTTPLPLMTASYVALNRAHAAQLGWTNEVVADMLTTGITLSYGTLDDHFGTDISGDAAAYAAARVADMGTFGAMQVIAEEKWASLFGMGFDAWTEWRVNGFPDLKPATDFFNDGNIPRRYLYPTEESTLNHDMYMGGVGALTPASDHNSSRVWWDK